MRLDRVKEGWSAETERSEERQIPEKKAKKKNKQKVKYLDVIVLAGVKQKVFLMVSACFGPCLDLTNN